MLRQHLRNGDDGDGYFTLNSATVCTLTFATPYTYTPACQCDVWDNVGGEGAARVRLVNSAVSKPYGGRRSRSARDTFAFLKEVAQLA